MSLNQQPLFNPYFSRVPLHRQFLQESTDKRSSTIFTKFSTKKQLIALFSVWKDRLHETQKNESRCWVPHRRAAWTSNPRPRAFRDKILPWWHWRCRCCCSSGRVLPSPARRWLVTRPVQCPWPQRRSHQPIMRKQNLVHSDMCTSIWLVFMAMVCHLFFFALLLYCWRLCVFLDARYGFSLDLELFCRSQLSLLGKIFDLEHAKQKC